MYKLNLEKYKIDNNGKSIDYDVAGSLKILLLAPIQEHNGLSLIEMADLCKKFVNKESFVLLEDAEMDKIKTAFNKIKGLSENEEELARRVINAEKIEVEPKK